ncbi:hypothetical protein N7493_009964 [Penicillium malachiteum]|uniref:Uncharacterized protein n=1 Tax=Penicillium malachiteum TaxID=1324776 RepID=A0AAD6MS83_9EURO|nr:hypothetical protein N7493_009964 [Penicillium malachiteum]
MSRLKQPLSNETRLWIENGRGKCKAAAITRIALDMTFHFYDADEVLYKIQGFSKHTRATTVAANLVTDLSWADEKPATLPPDGTDFSDDPIYLLVMSGLQGE